MRKISCLLIASFLFLGGCSIQCGTGGEVKNNGKQISISVASWNMQEFFDAYTEGTEYTEFKSSAHWSRDKYLVRLQRACEVLNAINADVYILEEVENEGVLYDISNQMAGKSWDSAKNWNYACFAKESGSSIGCAILSRFPLNDIKTHAIDIRTVAADQPSVRPLLEAGINLNGKVLKIIACHWKSKSGGEEDSEIWRDWQEFSAANLAIPNKTEEVILFAGDFNRSAEDFITDFSDSYGSPNSVFRGFENVSLYNPWFCEDGSFSAETGTYYFDDQWERIDNFFVTNNARLTAFLPKTGGWTKNEMPYAYKIYNGEGYSDHIPIVCTVIM